MSMDTQDTRPLDIQPLAPSLYIEDAPAPVGPYCSLPWSPDFSLTRLHFSLDYGVPNWYADVGIKESLNNGNA